MLPVASTGDDWKIAEQIVNQIQLPTIPNEKFVVDVSNTSQSAARTPIQSVINKASASGGGTVIKSGRDADGRIRGSKVASFKHLFWFQLNYPSNLHGNFPANYTDIIIEDLTVENVGTVLEIHAPDAAPVHNVKFKDIKIKEAGDILILENAKDIYFDNIIIGEQVWNGTFSAQHVKSVGSR